MARYIDIDKLKEMIEAKADTLIEGKEAFLYIAKWLDLLPSTDIKADTVRKMRERLTTFFANDDNLKYNEVDAEYINEQIDQIAKEIIEEVTRR